MIEMLVVDLGGVAARYLPERRLAALATLSSLTPEVVHERLFASSFEQQAELGAYASDTILDAVQTQLGLHSGASELVEAWALAFEPDEGVLELLAGLGRPKALFTNNGPMIDACLAGPLRDLASVFEAVVCSWQIQARKPDTAAFQRAAERLGRTPEELALLDDRAENVEAARRCGWIAERVASEGELARVLEILGLAAE